MDIDKGEKIFDERKLLNLQVGLRGSEAYAQLRQAVLDTISAREGSGDNSRAIENIMGKDAFIGITPELFPSYVTDKGEVTPLSAHLPYEMQSFKKAQRAVRMQEVKMVKAISQSEVTFQIVKGIQGGERTRERIATRLTDGDPQLSLLDTWWRTADQCVVISGTTSALRKYQEAVSRRNTMIDKTIAEVDGSSFPVRSILTGPKIIMAGKKEGIVKDILGKVGLGKLTEYDNWGFYYPDQSDSMNISGGDAWLTLANFALATCQANGFLDQQLEPEFISEKQLKQLRKEGKTPRSLHKFAKQTDYESGDNVIAAWDEYKQRMWHDMRGYLAEVLISQGADPAAFPIGDLAVIDTDGERIGLRSRLEGLLRSAEDDIQRDNIERALRAVSTWDAYVARTSGSNAQHEVQAPSTQTALAIVRDADQAIQDPAVGANIMGLTGDLLNSQLAEQLTSGLNLGFEGDAPLTPIDIASRLNDPTISPADRSTLFTRMMTSVSGIRWLFNTEEFGTMQANDPRIQLQINELQLLLAYTRPTRLRKNGMFDDDDFVTAVAQARPALKEMVQYLRIFANPELANLEIAPEEENHDSVSE